MNKVQNNLKNIISCSGAFANYQEGLDWLWQNPGVQVSHVSDEDGCSVKQLFNPGSWENHPESF